MYVYPASWSFDRRLSFCQHVERRRIQTHGARRFFRMDDDSNKQFFSNEGMIRIVRSVCTPQCASGYVGKIRELIRG